MGEADEGAAQGPSADPGKVSLTGRQVLVIVSLFFCFPLGLVLLWALKEFTPKVRLILAVAGVLLWACFIGAMVNEPPEVPSRPATPSPVRVPSALPKFEIVDKREVAVGATWWTVVVPKGTAGLGNFKAIALHLLTEEVKQGHTYLVINFYDDPALADVGKGADRVGFIQYDREKGCKVVFCPNRDAGGGWVDEFLWRK